MDIEKIERRSLSADKKKRAQKDGSGQVRKIEAGLVIAGHSELYRDSQSRTLLKALQPPPRGETEKNFYKEITSSSLPELKILRTLCPRFHGTVLHNGENYLRLEDLTRPFRNPCIIDIKMGRVTWDPDATDAKRVREESKYPPLKMSGFQFLGCRLAGDGCGLHDHVKLDKKWGRGLLLEELKSGFETFLSRSGQPERRKFIVEAIKSKLVTIRDWFLTQNKFRFFAFSLLILYEGISKPDLNSQGSSDSEDDRASVAHGARVDVRMIDFAHVYPAEAEQLDENYLFGLNNLIKMLEMIE